MNSAIGGDLGTLSGRASLVNALRPKLGRSVVDIAFTSELRLERQAGDPNAVLVRLITTPEHAPRIAAYRNVRFELSPHAPRLGHFMHELEATREHLSQDTAHVHVLVRLCALGHDSVSGVKRLATTDVRLSPADLEHLEASARRDLGP